MLTQIAPYFQYITAKALRLAYQDVLENDMLVAGSLVVREFAFDQEVEISIPKTGKHLRGTQSKVLYPQIAPRVLLCSWLHAA